MRERVGEKGNGQVFVASYLSVTKGPFKVSVCHFYGEKGREHNKAEGETIQWHDIVLLIFNMCC
jgi:hypothetical protein